MGSHHFVGFTGDPVGVAHDLQLHVSLGHAAAETITDQLQQVRTTVKAESNDGYVYLADFFVKSD